MQKNNRDTNTQQVWGKRKVGSSREGLHPGVDKNGLKRSKTLDKLGLVPQNSELMHETWNKFDNTTNVYNLLFH